jgi:hypothetical protein
MDYEEFLGELYGLLNTCVVVTVSTILAGVDRPIAVMRGTLTRGTTMALAEESTLPGQPIAFFIGGRDSAFFVREADFKLGVQHGDLLEFGAGKTRVIIRPDLDT